MLKTKIKVGRREFVVYDTDLILDNGACYQILSCSNKGTYYKSNDLSKKLFNELRKLEGVFTSEGLRIAAQYNFDEHCTFWKFDIEHMTERLGFEKIV